MTEKPPCGELTAGNALPCRRKNRYEENLPHPAESRDTKGLKTDKTMNFKNQMSTTRGQSERLLASGVKPETAYMNIDKWGFPAAFPYSTLDGYEEQQDLTPSWSLARLLEMMPPGLDGYGTFYLNCGLHTERYNANNGDKAHKYNVEFGVGFSSSRHEDVFDCIIETVEWLIRNGHFNKDYLNGNAGNRNESV